MRIACLDEHVVPRTMNVEDSARFGKFKISLYHEYFIHMFRR